VAVSERRAEREVMENIPAETEVVDHRSRSGVVVGLGASAGGLEALAGFFSHMPTDTGMTFIVVQHLERHHESLLSELLGRQTRMPVEQAQDGVSPAPDHVYVIPPNARLTLERGSLRVVIPDEPEPRMPVDALFHSLAEDRGERAVGIVLSGALADGTSGLRAIKEHGGLTLAQSPGTAKHEAMPQSAIGAGVVDEVLSVEEMPARLLTHPTKSWAQRKRRVPTLKLSTTSRKSARSSTALPATISEATRPARWFAASAGGCSSNTFPHRRTTGGYSSRMPRSLSACSRIF
jgi:two-component system, chemotaxis family, CheB/CheR fusion protein